MLTHTSKLRICILIIWFDKFCVFYSIIIVVVVNIMEPKQAYEKFENELLKQLPADQPEFITLLEREGVIDGEAKKRMNVKNRNKAVRTVVILEEIEKSLCVSHEKFYKLLSAMKEYNHGVETLAEEIENHLDPSTYLCVHKLLTQATYVHCSCSYV